MSKKPTKGVREFVRVAQGPGGLKSKRFGPTATLTERKNWREDQRVAHRAAQAALPPGARVIRGTLAADVQRYLKQVQTMPSIKDRTRDLRYWVDVYGDMFRHQLTAEHYRLQLQEWKMGGGKDGKPLGASTVNHRRMAMMHVYTILDGKGANNPLRSVREFAAPPVEPRDMGMETALAILAALRPSTAKCRLAVQLWTGIRGECELGRMRREHVDLERGVCWVPTGKKGKPRQVNLSPEGIAAWREFIQRNCWGSYHSSTLGATFQRGVRRVNKARALRQLPPLPKLRPYDFRHTIATALRRSGADLADIQAFLGHASPEMTKRYAPYHSDKLVKALQLISEQVAGVTSAVTS